MASGSQPVAATPLSEPTRVAETSSNEVKLRREAEYLHHVLYSRAPSPEIIDEYIRAHQYCHVADNENRIERMIARALDAEAIEVASRRRRPALTQKLRMLVYLTETKPAYFPSLTNQANRPVQAWISLTALVVRSAYKLVKGNILLRWYPDV